MNSLTIGRFSALSNAGSEAINTLCTNLSFAGENIKKIMITSSHASEGKSFLSMNIMRTMAKLGKNVVLVDADLRRSVISSRYNLQFEDDEHRKGLAHFKGLAHLLAGMVNEEDVIYKTNIHGAYIIPVGREVSNPLPLLASSRFENLLDHLAQTVDCVLVDAPPVGLVIDGAEIAKSCDGTLLVVDYNSVRRQELIDVKEQLEQTECRILGTVLNRVEFDNYLSRKYYYKSYYNGYGYDHYDVLPGEGKHSSKRHARSRKK